MNEFQVFNYNKPKQNISNAKIRNIGKVGSLYFVPSVVALENKIRNVTTHQLRDFVLYMAGGATPLTSEAAIHYTETSDGIPFIRVQNLSTTGKLDLKDCKRITRSTHEGLLARSRLTGGELLVKITGVGRMAIASVVPEGFEGNINQHIVAIRTKDIKTSETLAAYLNLDMVEKLASRRSTGGTRPALDYPALLSIPIIFDERIPRLFKEAINKYVENQNKAKILIDKIDQTLLHELGIQLPYYPDNSINNRIFPIQISELSGNRFDPFRYHSYQRGLRNAVKNSPGEFIKLRHCLVNVIAGDWGEDEGNDFDPEKFERCLVIRNTEFDNDFNIQIESGREKYRLILKTKLRALDIKPFDLLIEKSGGSDDQPVGRAAILEPNHFSTGTICFSNFLMKIRANETIVDPLFLFIWLQASHRLGITQSMQAQTNGIRNLIVEEFLDQEIPLPKKEIQINIRDQILEQINRAKQLQQHAIKDLETAKHMIERMILGEG